jgi:hypothetical protein
MSLELLENRKLVRMLPITAGFVFVTLALICPPKDGLSNIMTNACKEEIRRQQELNFEWTS